MALTNYRVIPSGRWAFLLVILNKNEDGVEVLFQLFSVCSEKDKSVACLLKLDGKRYRVIMSGGLGALEKSESGGSLTNGHDLGHTPFTRHVDRSFFSSMPITCSTPNLPSSSDLDAVFESASKDKIKRFLRASHWPPNHEVRGSLWRKICETVRQCRGNIYEETLKDTFGVGE